MYSTHNYGTILLGTNKLSGKNHRIIETMEFGGYDFSDIIISNIPDSYAGNDFAIQYYHTATHGQGLNSWHIKGKKFTMQWRIRAESASSLEKTIDRIKAYLLKGKQTLSIVREYGVIQTQALVSSLSIPREQRTVNAVPINIGFDIFSPFWYGIEKTEKGFSGITSVFNELIPYYNGSYPTTPIIYITFNEASWVDTIHYELNNKIVSITTPISAGTVICIDGEKINVTKDGTHTIDWHGEFGELPIGERPIKITMNWSFSAEIFIVYKNCYV